MISDQDRAAAPYVPARHGRDVALPLLDAMVPALSAQARQVAGSVRRLGYVYIPMGMNAARVDAGHATGAWSCRRRCSALTPVLDHVTVLSGLELRNAYTTGNHASSNCAFLSCSKAKRTEGSDYELGTTVESDRGSSHRRGHAAAVAGDWHGSFAQVGNCDNGYACAYQNNLSWSSPTTPLPTEAIRGWCSSGCSATAAAPNAGAPSCKKSGSILDWMTDDLARLRRELGPRSARVGQYLDSVREVERRIQRAEQTDARAPGPDPAGQRAGGVGRPRGLMFDLQVLALRPTSRASITFQLARETSTRTYPHIGVPEPHHPVSHHVNDPEKLVKLAKINAHHVSLFAYLRREAGGDAGRRRVAARSHPVSARQRHG